MADRMADNQNLRKSAIRQKTVSQVFRRIMSLMADFFTKLFFHQSYFYGRYL